MGKPYSLDLRKRVVAAIEGGMSRNQAAKQFGVAISTAINWMKRVDETGSVAPGQIGGHKPKAISGEHASGCRSGLGTMISPYADSSPSLPDAV
jgi:transposase